MRPLRRLMDELELCDSADDDKELKLAPVEMHDILAALERTKRSAGDRKAKYTQWQREFGAS